MNSRHTDREYKKQLQTLREGLLLMTGRVELLVDRVKGKDIRHLGKLDEGDSASKT